MRADELVKLLEEASETIHGRQQRDPSYVSADLRNLAAEIYDGKHKLVAVEPEPEPEPESQ